MNNWQPTPTDIQLTQVLREYGHRRDELKYQKFLVEKYDELHIIYTNVLGKNHTISFEDFCFYMYKNTK